MSSPRPPFEPPGWHCTRRPNRSKPRVVDAKAAARMVCKAIDNGATMEEVKQAIKAKCDIDCGNPECEEELAKIKALLDLIQGAVVSWLVWILLFEAAPMLGLFRWLTKLLPGRILKLLGYADKLKRLEKLKADGLTIRKHMEEVAAFIELVLKK